MQTSQLNIAINSDPHADRGIVGDLFDVIPAIVERLKRREPQQ